MSVLSDSEIRTRMAGGQLVVGGDPARASECSYSFVSGAAFLAGSTDAAKAFPGPDGTTEVVVLPGQMIWIRTLERVAIPTDIVGLWWQTNTLSKKGLMLVNMSMIEPGYEGDLACLFVNFGKSRIAIGPATIIAKMVFLRISGETLHPFLPRMDRPRYDAALRELAIDQPTTFLDVGDLSVNLGKEKEAALAAIKAEAASIRDQTEKIIAEMEGELKVRAKTAIEDARTAAVKGFANDIPRTLLQYSGLAAGALALLTAATYVADQIRDHTTPDLKTIARTEAEATLRDRMVISAAPGADIAALTHKIDALNARIAAIDKKAP
jgi:deoxycytidine triphosphate deaminase